MNIERRIIIETPFSKKNITSYGLAVYAKDTERWALIKRKHTVEFLIFIRGMYRISCLSKLLKQITQEEATIILNCLYLGPNYYKNYYYNILKLPQKDFEYSLLRLAESRLVVLNLLSKLDLSNNQLQWLWPKGRLNHNSIKESPLECAKREFMEEMEVDLPDALCISNTYIGELIQSITCKNIESRYWVYIIDKEIPLTECIDHQEISERIWVDTETCRKLINNDNLFIQAMEIKEEIL